MKNYNFSRVNNEGRETLNDMIQLTGAEVSFNTLPAGEKVAFVHSHKENEEIYIVLEGKGKVVIDDETIELEKGNVLKVAPEGKRQFFAAETQPLNYVCIQVKVDSLSQFTENDAIIY